MDERARRTERLARSEGPEGLLRLATERLRAGAREEALRALAGVEDPRALALQGEVLLGLERLDEAWAAAAASVRADPAALSPEVAVPLARRLLAAADPGDPLARLAALRRAVDLGDAALEALASAGEDPDPLARGLAARVPALRAALRDDASPYVRFMAASPDPDGRANAWRRLTSVELDPAAGTVQVPLPEGGGFHQLRLEVEAGAVDALTLRVHDARRQAHEQRTLGHPGMRRVKCPIPARTTRALELGHRPGPGGDPQRARLGVWVDDTAPTATRLFGAHGPDFETDLFLAFEARYPARLAFFETAFFRAVARLLFGRDDLLSGYGGSYGLGFAAHHDRSDQVHARVEALERSGVLPFHVELTGPRPFDHLRGLAPSDTLPADDERLARRFAQDLRGHPARLEGPQQRELHRQILGLFPPGRTPPPAELDPLLDRARVEYGPVGYRAVEAFVERAIAEAPGGAVGAPLGRSFPRRVKPEEDQR